MLLPSRGPALTDRNAEFVFQQQFREIGRRLEQVGAMDFFNMITGPELLETLVDGYGRRAGRCAAAAAELQTYGAGVGGVESKAVPLNGTGRYGGPVALDRPRSSR